MPLLMYSEVSPRASMALKASSSVGATSLGSLWKHITWWTQSLNPFYLNPFCLVPQSDLPPVLLNMIKDGISRRFLNFAVHVVSWLSGTSSICHCTAQPSLLPPLFCPTSNTARTKCTWRAMTRLCTTKVFREHLELVDCLIGMFRFW
jgi:hypothetical protein